ncbi:hypothetical protein N656DRAFT_797576 [Canariomyces notabilis]|uniref:Ankyrin repeat protein n=1 Tax=Canariomyces notabilis TaxID=2074819 RepID=A0AAN6YTE6_9PEZI|nr:hypothetical protein N656DRAFT_797576 [Canariomyces arenarius]
MDTSGPSVRTQTAVDKVPPRDSQPQGSLQGCGPVADKDSGRGNDSGSVKDKQTKNDESEIPSQLLELLARNDEQRNRVPNNGSQSQTPVKLMKKLLKPKIPENQRPSTPSSSGMVDGQTAATNKGKGNEERAIKARQTPEIGQPSSFKEAPTLVVLNWEKLPASKPPKLDIVAVHDAGQTNEGAWTFIPDPQSQKREHSRTADTDMDISRSRGAGSLVARSLGVGPLGTVHPIKTDEEMANTAKKTKNWLTDPTMIAGDFDGARIMAFSYRPPEVTVPPSDPTAKSAFDKYLQNIASTLLSQLVSQRSATNERDYSRVPLVFIGCGFGCLVIQKLISLADGEGSTHEEGPLLSPILKLTAGIMLLDTPTPLGAQKEGAPRQKGGAQKEDGEQIEGAQKEGASAGKEGAPREDGAQDEAIRESTFPPTLDTGSSGWAGPFLKTPTINTRHLWDNFTGIAAKKSISVCWFYAQDPSTQDIKPRADGVEFVVIPLPVSATKPKPSHTQGRFLGPKDDAYIRLVDHIRGSLMFKASEEAVLEPLLGELIRDNKYNFEVTDRKGRNPLHRMVASLNYKSIKLIAAAYPGLIAARDDDGNTPLHTLVFRVMDLDLKDDDRKPYEDMFRDLEKIWSESLHTLHTFSSGTVTGSIAGEDAAAVALFMPIFGFEEHPNCEKLSNSIKCLEECDPQESQSGALVNAYFRSKMPLHCRRTLDQFTYHMLEDTKERDDTQVVTKWAKEHPKRREVEYDAENDSASHKHDANPVLMIDQLWLWVLKKENMVIACIPETWDSNPTKKTLRTDHSFICTLWDELTRDNRTPITSSMELASLIIRCSIDFIQRPGPGNFSLYECFQSTIDDIAERQAKQFSEFKHIVDELSKPHDPKTWGDMTDELFRLPKETALLAEIMDVLDELKTIRQVFLKQKDVLDKLRQLPSDFKQPLPDHLDKVNANIEAADDMASRATRVHADTMIAFTSVTIFFLPLSFIAAVFAIQVDSFPKDPVSGQNSWPVQNLMSLLFGISLAVIIPLEIVAFNFYRIADYLADKKRKLVDKKKKFADIKKKLASEKFTREKFPDLELGIRWKSGRILSMELWQFLVGHSASGWLPLYGMKYAWIFGRWSFNRKIPLLRRLWEFRLYPCGDYFEVDYPLRRMVAVMVDAWRMAMEIETDRDEPTTRIIAADRAWFQQNSIKRHRAVANRSRGMPRLQQASGALF